MGLLVIKVKQDYYTRFCGGATIPEMTVLVWREKKLELSKIDGILILNIFLLNLPSSGNCVERKGLRRENIRNSDGFFQHCFFRTN